ncbi:MAG: DNRLRE domain-containing protein, partial [Chloroflexota bacterium]|nr:DNRLRE domain-containing protein [Chloroflexota bacterium]
DVAKAGNVFTITLTVDEPWLKSPERKFPVLLDPTIELQPPTEDLSIRANSPSSLPVTYDRLLLSSGSDNYWRGALKFDLGDLPKGASITDARLKLFFDGICHFGDLRCGAGPHQIDAHRMSRDWNTSTITSDFAFDPTVLSSYTLPNTTGGHVMSWSVTGTVSDWYLGIQPNYGFLLKRHTEALNELGPRPPGRRFTADPSYRPKIDVSWSGDAVNLLKPDTVHSNGAELRWERYVGGQ